MYKPLLAALMLVSLPLSFAQARTPNDTYYSDQWYLPKVGAPAAWDITTGGPVVIAVLDTGVDLDHPDLVKNLWVNADEIPDNGKDDDHNGFIDDYRGWDFVNNDNTPEADPSTGVDNGAVSHGTLVAGLIAAQTNNSLGFAGMMWNAQIMPLRVLNQDGAGGEDTTAAAVDYAVANGAKVINMSFSGSSSGSRLRTSIRQAYEAGVVIIAALGNNGADLNVTPEYPACFHSETDDWVLGVAATGMSDEETEFTNYGSNCADLSAPGVDIFGLDHQDGHDPADSAYGGPWDGTSISSPIVAGAAGLLLSKYPNLTPTQVFTILKLSVDPIRTTISGAGAIGVGRLNIAKALDLAPSFVAMPATPTDTSSPVVAPPSVKSPTTEPTADEHFGDSAHYSFIALGSPSGAVPTVQVTRADGTPYATFTAYTTNFSGGVHVATADLDHDGIPEIVTGAGPSGGPHVRLFKAYGAVISEFFAYDKASSQGVNVAVGDVDGDGTDEIVTAVGAGVSNDVIVWSQTGQEISRFTVTGFPTNAPLSVAVADVDNDWEKEIIVYSETTDSRVAVYNADGSPLVSFEAFPGDPNGVRLGVGDLDGDFRDEIITTGGTGSQAQVRVYNKIGAYWGGFATPQTDPNGRLNVSVTDIDVNGEPDIVLSPRNTPGDVGVYSLTGDLLENVGSGLVSARGGYLSAW